MRISSKRVAVVLAGTAVAAVATSLVAPAAEAATHTGAPATAVRGGGDDPHGSNGWHGDRSDRYNGHQQHGRDHQQNGSDHQQHGRDRQQNGWDRQQNGWDHERDRDQHGRGHGGDRHGRQDNHHGQDWKDGRHGWQGGGGGGGGHGHNWGGGGYRVVGHYRSYRDCWNAGNWGRGRGRWHSYDCYESGGSWVLHVN